MKTTSALARAALILTAAFATTGASVVPATAAGMAQLPTGTARPATVPAAPANVRTGAGHPTAEANPSSSIAVRPLATGGCWYSGTHWWCNNVSGAPVYNSAYAVVGYMYSNPSWFICRSDFGGYVGGPHPYRWEYTQADNGAWGWMKDTAIYSETNPLPVC
jgi:hypothetical protein